MTAMTMPLPDRNRSAAAICAAIQENFRNCGLSHLSVEVVSAEPANSVCARVVDPNGTVVLTIQIDEATGVIRDWA